MADLRDAARQALDALEEFGTHYEHCPRYPTWARPELQPPCDCGYDNSVSVIRTALKQPNECHWYQDGDEDSDKWAASCGRHRYFQLNDGTPTDNRMSHCCYCGKPLVEVPIEPEDNHD